jgi:hypothetical protein
MTLDEAIQHCEERASCGDKCGLEHKQLADWLKELRTYRMSDKRYVLSENDYKTMCKSPKFDDQLFRLINDLNKEILPENSNNYRYTIEYSGISKSGNRFNGRKFTNDLNEANNKMDFYMDNEYVDMVSIQDGKYSIKSFTRGYE